MDSICNVCSIHNSEFDYVGGRVCGGRPMLGDIVKIRGDGGSMDFSLDYIVGPGTRYDGGTFIDIVSMDNMTYILGGNRDGEYFIIVLDSGIFASRIELGNGEPGGVSLIGNIGIRGDHIVVILYNVGIFNVVGDRLSVSSNTGILFNIYNSYVISYRTLLIPQKFLLFGGGEEFLYFAQANILQRFNANTSPSWTQSIYNAMIDATTIPGIIILLYGNYFQGLDNTNGSMLWNMGLTGNAQSCVGYGTNLYIGSIIDTGILVSQWTIGTTGPTLNLINSIPTTPIPESLFISTLDNDKYIVSTEFRISIYPNTEMVPIAQFDLTSILQEFVYKFTSRHLIGSIPIIINAIQPITVNGDIRFPGIGPYAGFFVLYPDYPQIAGVITNINKDKFFVTLHGSILNYPKTLLPHQTYYLNMQGHLQMRTGRKFLITGKDPYSATIIYNSL